MTDYTGYGYPDTYVDGLRAEIERLKAALQEIAAYPHSEYGGEIARRALEHEHKP